MENDVWLLSCTLLGLLVKQMMEAFCSDFLSSFRFVLKGTTLA